MTIRVDQLVLVLGATAIIGFLLVGFIIILATSTSDYSGEFDLSGVTTYEPCLQAPGGCPCLRTRDCAQRLKDFREHPVFWLGESFEGLPLTNVDFADYGQENGRRRREVSMTYGSCVPSADGFCPAPLTIQISRFCESPGGPAPVPDTSFEFRGADAYAQNSSIRPGPWMLLRTSNVAIEFEAGAEYGGAEQVATDLVRANGGWPTSPGEPFEPPSDDCYPDTPTPSATP